MFYRSMTALCLLATQANAETPNVVTDIAPVHSLVARVMQGVGEPTMLMPQGASPHHHAMRPSEARALQNADLVVWIGEDLTPWLEDGVETLAAKAHSLELLHLKGTTAYTFREEAVFGEHHDHDDHADHDGHDDHDHEDHKDHDGHDHEKHEKEHHEEASHEGHDDHDHHDHEGEDPHAWLAPENAIFWLGVIADELSEIDPNNAELYAMNAKGGVAEIEAAVENISAKLTPLHDARYVVFHDAYQYFERAFDISSTGALHLSDATPPSAGRLAEIQEEITEHGISCVFAEPQYNSALVASVAPDGIKTGILDPLGINLPAGPQLYTALLRDLADSAVECLQ